MSGQRDFFAVFLFGAGSDIFDMRILSRSWPNGSPKRSRPATLYCPGFTLIRLLMFSSSSRPIKPSAKVEGVPKADGLNRRAPSPESRAPSLERYNRLSPLEKWISSTS